ncbi:MAG: sugar transferase [Gammaproteobacteria bacterium]|nr:sugar transferase [Gammaproteobacteria bacterium]
MAKRLFDLVFSIPALVVLSPLMIVCAIWIKLDSNGPVLFRQERIGREGVPFKILKFRTMADQNTGSKPLLTTQDDERITRCGKILRRLKIDELPQFVNVVAGQMSIVGPRPEVGKYVDLYPESSRQKILSVRPGITDNASIKFRDEGAMLAAADNPEQEYIETILPTKLSIYEEYVDNQSLAGDLLLILRTAWSVVR